MAFANSRFFYWRAGRPYLARHNGCHHVAVFGRVAAGARNLGRPDILWQSVQSGRRLLYRFGKVVCDITSDVRLAEGVADSVQPSLIRLLLFAGNVR